ncbi:MAG: hypothetical protein IPM79_24280 [Polyangiaceae bacterium]|nr:hypothetical protein [Polyangiaceae bacterium]MBK8940645.1 hypothetical protein [Polyangiaceae bacterium]
MDQEEAALFERVIWVEATLRHFDPVPADVILNALNTHEPALIEGRSKLDRALRKAEERYDPELSNRCAWEMARATAAVHATSPTLDSLRAAFATGSIKDVLPDLAGWFGAWKNQ